MFLIFQYKIRIHNILIEMEIKNLLSFFLARFAQQPKKAIKRWVGVIKMPNQNPNKYLL